MRPLRANASMLFSRASVAPLAPLQVVNAASPKWFCGPPFAACGYILGLAREGGFVDCELLHTPWKNIELG